MGISTFTHQLSHFLQGPSGWLAMIPTQHIDISSASSESLRIQVVLLTQHMVQICADLHIQRTNECCQKAMFPRSLKFFCLVYSINMVFPQQSIGQWSYSISGGWNPRSAWCDASAAADFLDPCGRSPVATGRWWASVNLWINLRTSVRYITIVISILYLP